jgi:hypothetical protein
MGEDNKAGLDTDQVTPETKPTELTIDEIKAQIKEELEGKYKNEISTRDQKLTQYQKDLKARMTEEERIKSESQRICLKSLKGLQVDHLDLTINIRL